MNKINTYKKGAEEDERDEVRIGQRRSAGFVRLVCPRVTGSPFETCQHNVRPRLARRTSARRSSSRIGWSKFKG